jgi:hypothetical protein
MASYSVETLSKLKLVELKALCVENKFPVSGTKNVLIARLLGHEPAPKKKTPVTKKKKPLAPKQFASKDLNAVLKTLKSTVEPILIKRNQFGNYEHAETSFVFAVETKRVIGKQRADGHVVSLSLADLDVLNQFHFQKDDNFPIDTTVSAMGRGGPVKEVDDARLAELLEFAKKS